MKSAADTSYESRSRIRALTSDGARRVSWSPAARRGPPVGCVSGGITASARSRPGPHDGVSWPPAARRGPPVACVSGGIRASARSRPRPHGGCRGRPPPGAVRRSTGASGMTKHLGKLALASPRLKQCRVEPDRTGCRFSYTAVRNGRRAAATPRRAMTGHDCSQCLFAARPRTRRRLVLLRAITGVQVRARSRTATSEPAPAQDSAHEPRPLRSLILRVAVLADWTISIAGRT